MNKTLNYSPNFDPKKRKFNEIKFIIFHYTGMNKEKDALIRLCNYKSKVSSHYFIGKSGEIITLVPDTYIAWHAGISSWKNFKSLNKHSIGIEISNSGHDNKYEDFSKQQLKSIVKLTKSLIKKYNIESKFILGHSDISPDRKKDPGEKFPWKFLSKKKIGLWYNLSEKKLLNIRNQKISKTDKKIFLNNLYKIGYKKKTNVTKITNIKILTTAFQRRFRQSLVNGIIDRECLIISENLMKKTNI
tara:strand:+ start:1 stop:735 length:735 start_codon:yes stop_codon:yes gene_type:complete